MKLEVQEQKIIEFAQQLEDSTIGKQHSPYALPPTEVHEGSGNKGSFGQFLENNYFGLETNSRPLPDFWPVQLELKAVPLKQTEKNGLVPKERIVLGIINFDEIVNESFETSHFQLKNKAILMVWYIYSKILENEDMEIPLVDVWRCIQEDGFQIESDWNVIADKVKTGHAEDISEGDTLYLGACTKGSTAEASYRRQPFSDVLAKQRAFCFKISYVKHIYDVMKERRSTRQTQEHFLSNTSKTIEQRVNELFSPYIYMSATELEENLNIHTTAKSKFAMIARAIIGYSGKTKSFYEFDAANIQIKTIRIEKNGKNKESMSFKNITYCDIVEQEWEDSDLYQELTSKFIFVIFRRNTEDSDYVLDCVKFWNMPEKDLEQVQPVWEKTKFQILANDYEHFSKESEHPIVHVRPKGQNNLDLMKTPQGGYEKKKCFFLNKAYIIREIVCKNL